MIVHYLNQWINFKGLLKVCVIENHKSDHAVLQKCTVDARARLICPSVYPQPSGEQLIEHYLNSTQQEAASDTTYMG